MPSKLFNMDIKEISGVDKAANRKKFLIVKQEGGEGRVPKNNENEMDTICKVAAEALKITIDGTIDKEEDFEKAMEDIGESMDEFMGFMKAATVTASFAANMAASDIRSNLYRAGDSLHDTIAAVLGDKDLTKDEKKSAIEDSMGEFTSWIMGIVDSATAIQKAGAKISTDRLSRLKVAYQSLGDIIQEAEGGEPIQKGGEEELEKLQKKDIESMVTDVLEPVIKRLEALEGKDEPAGENEEIKKMITDAVETAVSPLVARIEVVEKARGIKKSADGQEGDVQKNEEQGFWAGVL